MQERVKHELNLLSSAIELLYDKAWNTEEILYITNEAFNMLTSNLKAKSNDIVSLTL